MSYLRRPDTAFSLDPNRKDQGGRLEYPRHLAFVRTLPCLVLGTWGSTEAAHLRGASPAHRKGMTPMGRKPDDCWVVPLSSGAHRAQHSMNEAEFWRRNGIDPFAVAEELFRHTGDHDTCLMILARARRGGERPPWAR